jgi:hypothetical protein
MYAQKIATVVPAFLPAARIFAIAASCSSLPG